ncbi:unnamed protein product [Spodoptera littoralis]|uniref:Uncharacterized protein n=1 Tax=Spodoptera littoralis TaxID=7109 RepID=A0A9P0IMS1_SPOLI|nr:unnamed protein product [Spodoptera littoralis]CAH1647843.1 unnamed protein product [Spodoptera littoralis]
MSTWRMAGLNYVNYSNIAANTLRKSLKTEHRDAAIKRGIPTVKYYYWENGQMLAHGQKLKVVEKERVAAKA